MTTCVRCDLDAAGGAVFADDLWSLWPLRAVPGWLFLQTRRHVERIESLSRDELTSLGPTLARVSSAVREAAAAEKVYFAIYLENHLHFHVAVLARPASVPVEHRGAQYLLHADDYDGRSEEAKVVVERIRAALAGAG